MNCNWCVHFHHAGGIHHPLGFCVDRQVPAIADTYALDCAQYTPAAAAYIVVKSMLKSAFFAAAQNHQRRSSTADESGLPDFSSKAEAVK